MYIEYAPVEKIWDRRADGRQTDASLLPLEAASVNKEICFYAKIKNITIVYAFDPIKCYITYNRSEFIMIVSVCLADAMGNLVSFYETQLDILFTRIS